MQSSSDYPDLIVEQCPLGCENCGEIYVNDQIGHRIVCRCIRCNHNKKEKLTLAEVGAPETNVAKSVQASSRRRP